MTKEERDNALYEPVAPMIPAPHWMPSSNYNAMIYPLISFAIKGVIWYQGEANDGRAYQYRTLFPAMIKNWRQDWAQGDFPFFIRAACELHAEAFHARPELMGRASRSAANGA